MFKKFRRGLGGGGGGKDEEGSDNREARDPPRGWRASKEKPEKPVDRKQSASPMHVPKRAFKYSYDVIPFPTQHPARALLSLRPMISAGLI